MKIKTPRRSRKYFIFNCDCDIHLWITNYIPCTLSTFFQFSTLPPPQSHQHITSPTHTTTLTPPHHRTTSHRNTPNQNTTPHHTTPYHMSPHHHTAHHTPAIHSSCCATRPLDANTELRCDTLLTCHNKLCVERKSFWRKLPIIFLLNNASIRVVIQLTDTEALVCLHINN